MSTLTTTAYLVLEARRRHYGPLQDDGLRLVGSIGVAAVRKNRPTKLERDQIAVRVELSVDDAVFSPITADMAMHLDPATLIRPVLQQLAPEAGAEVDQ